MPRISETPPRLLPAIRFLSGSGKLPTRFFESVAACSFGPEGYRVVQATYVRIPGIPSMWHMIVRADARGWDRPRTAYRAAGPVVVGQLGRSMSSPNLSIYLDGQDDELDSLTLACQFDRRAFEMQAECGPRHTLERRVEGKKWRQHSWPVDIAEPLPVPSDIPRDSRPPPFPFTHVTLTQCDTDAMNETVSVRWAGDAGAALDVQFHLNNGSIVWLGGSLTRDGTTRDLVGAVHEVPPARASSPLDGSVTVETATTTAKLLVRLPGGLRPVSVLDAVPWAVRQIMRKVGRRLTTTTHVGPCTLKLPDGTAVPGTALYERSRDE